MFLFYTHNVQKVPLSSSHVIMEGPSTQQPHASFDSVQEVLYGHLAPLLALSHLPRIVTFFLPAAEYPTIQRSPDPLARRRPLKGSIGT